MTEYERQKQAYLEKCVRNLYTSPIGKGEVKRFCIVHNITYKKVNLLARKLKCFQTRKNLWTPEEVKILERNKTKGGKAVKNILKLSGFDRSLHAIYHRFIKGSLPKPTDNGYKVKELAIIMGISHNVILRWIEHGFLRAKLEEKTNTYFLKIKDVREFIIQNVGIISIPNIDKYWLVDILANKKGNL